MSLTLLGYARSLPELGGRVWPDVVVGTAVPPTPYALVWDKPGGVTDPYHGGGAVLGVNPCVTVYVAPQAGETPGGARVRLLAIGRALMQAVGRVDTHSDGVTPLIPGSFQLQALLGPRPDASAPGQLYLTVQFTARLLFTPEAP